MEYIKLQCCCLILVLYIAFVYYRDLKRIKKRYRFSMFDVLLFSVIICLVFDGITAYMVNHLESVSRIINQTAHMCFLISIDSVIFILFLYTLYITEGFPKRKAIMLLLYSPFIINLIVLVCNINALEYKEGTVTNYSMGVSAYTCFIMVGVYILFTIVVFFRRWNYIERHKRASILLYMIVLSTVTTYQMIIPESLVTSIAVTIIVIGVYVNLENPALNELAEYHKEMVMGFATLVENRDDNTGGHIRRTSAYAQLLARELRNRGYYTWIKGKRNSALCQNHGGGRCF